ncbi:hypothetical protein AC1031_004868 [Aphanomyces cochlioides]|nr:hypothetical protein AC1031_004868 [Aphanomyces cochlioides]
MKRLENISDDDLAALNTDEGEDCSILDYAVFYRDLDLIKTLLENTNIPNCGSPLMNAVECSTFDIAQYLADKLNTSLDFNYTNSDGSTVLHVAALYESNDILDILAPIAGQVDILNQDGETPLMHAVKGNNERGVEILIRAGADIHLKSQDGKTALFYASAEGFKCGVKLLLKAGAIIDIKDNDGRYVIQAAANNEIKEMIHLERLTRALYPVHVVARNGDLKALQKWLSATTVKGPGRKQVWHGKHLQNGDSTDIELQFKLVRDTEIYKCVGTFADEGGVYHLSGEWNSSQLKIKKSYADVERIVEYDGEVDDETGEWTGEYKTGGESADGEFKFSIPFFQCSKCSSKVPEENVLCFKCDSVEPRYWQGKFLEDGQWKEFEIEFAIREDVPAKLYRLKRPGYDPSDSDFYSISGTLKDGSINFAQHYAKHSVFYQGEFEHETKKWIGQMISATGGTKQFRIDIPVWPCTTCGTNVPNENAKCLKCCHDSIYYWKG